MLEHNYISCQYFAESPLMRMHVSLLLTRTSFHDFHGSTILEISNDHLLIQSHTIKIFPTFPQSTILQNQPKLKILKVLDNNFPHIWLFNSIIDFMLGNLVFLCPSTSLKNQIERICETDPWTDSRWHHKWWVEGWRRFTCRLPYAY